ncbi:MAG TPA: hypothetical protein VMK13_09945 [Streptosporangiaceae bacterium]|nr:hypothetical protein [Streptosporangiaceae bacterium]
MSMPACRQRVLDSTDGTLQKRDPRLASMFSVFTRPAGHEPSPSGDLHEQSSMRQRTPSPGPGTRGGGYDGARLPDGSQG